MRTAWLDFNQSISSALQLHSDPARKCRDGMGEPGTRQSVTPGRADINSPHREEGTDPTPARAAAAPPRAHGQGRFSSELGLRRCYLKYHGATRPVAVTGSGDCLSSLFPRHKPLPKALGAKDSATAGRDSTHTSTASSWRHPDCTAGTKVSGPARPLPAA